MWREASPGNLASNPLPPFGPLSRRERGQAVASSARRFGKVLAIMGALAVMVTGCTVHPRGEAGERRAAKESGSAFAHRFESRTLAPLPANPTPDDLVNYAVHANADLEQRYWEWRAAIEQIPIEGTQPANVMFSASSMISKGNLSWDTTTLGVGNDPMSNVVWPDKLSAAARRALEEARAAGARFQGAGYALRANVLGAYYDYALAAELIRIEESTAELLGTTASVVEARNRAGSAAQQDVLRAQNELDMSRNDLANMRAQLPAMRATVNALLGREATADLAVPQSLAASSRITAGDDQVLAWAAERNPELAALAAETRGKQDGIRIARLQYFPDFSLNFNTDLAGLTQSLMGAVSVPLLRGEALRAGVAQAEARLRAAEAMRRQYANDLAARTVGDLLTVRDADRQLALIDDTLLPRARQVIVLTRSAYESGRAGLLDLLDAQRSLLTLQRLSANLRATREKRLATLEAAAARSLRETR